MATVTVDGGEFSARITYTSKEDMERNTSTITVSSVEVKSRSRDYGLCCIEGTVMFGRKTAVYLNLEGWTRCQFEVSRSWNGGNGSVWSGWESNSVRLSHNEDGTLEANAEINFNVYTTNTVNGAVTLVGEIECTKKIQLPTIPRSSGISAASVQLGQQMEISITKASDSFTSTVGWSCGTQQGTIAEKSESTEFMWTPPLRLAEVEPTKEAAAITLTVTTYRGTTEVGIRSVTILCPVPETIVPTISVTVLDGSGHTERYGGYIQGKSKVRVVTAAAGVYGSEIMQIAVECGAITATGADVTIVPDSSGTIRITATDSRGRKASATKQISVLAYTAPVVELTELYRCDANGVDQRDGTSGKAVFSARCTSLGGKNKIHYSVRVRQRGSTTVQETGLPQHENAVSLTGAVGIFAAGIDRDYEVSIQVTDSFGVAESAVRVLSVAFALMDFNRNGKAVGIGTRATENETLRIGLDVNLDGNRISNVADPEGSGDVMTAGKALALLDALYPVGTIYLSMVDFCAPAYLGGTWEVLPGDSYLVTSGTGHTPTGQAEGSSERTITQEQLPAHTHGQRMGSGPMVDGDCSGTKVKGTLAAALDDEWYKNSYPQVMTDAAGGGQPINIEPKHLAVYGWARVK